MNINMTLILVITIAISFPTRSSFAQDAVSILQKLNNYADSFQKIAVSYKGNTTLYPIFDNREDAIKYAYGKRNETARGQLEPANEDNIEKIIQPSLSYGYGDNEIIEKIYDDKTFMIICLDEGDIVTSIFQNEYETYYTNTNQTIEIRERGERDSSACTLLFFKKVINKLNKSNSLSIKENDDSIELTTIVDEISYSIQVDKNQLLPQKTIMITNDQKIEFALDDFKKVNEVFIPHKSIMYTYEKHPLSNDYFLYIKTAYNIQDCNINQNMTFGDIDYPLPSSTFVKDYRLNQYFVTESVKSTNLLSFKKL